MVDVFLVTYEGEQGDNGAMVCRAVFEHMRVNWESCDKISIHCSRRERLLGGCKKQRIV